MFDGKPQKGSHVCFPRAMWPCRHEQKKEKPRQTERKEIEGKREKREAERKRQHEKKR